MIDRTHKKRKKSKIYEPCISKIERVLAISVSQGKESIKSENTSLHHEKYQVTYIDRLENSVIPVMQR